MKNPNVQDYIKRAQAYAAETGQPVDVAQHLVIWGDGIHVNGSRQGIVRARPLFVELKSEGHDFPTPWDAAPAAEVTPTAPLEEIPAAPEVLEPEPTPAPTVEAPAPTPTRAERAQREHDLRTRVVLAAVQYALATDQETLAWADLLAAAESLGAADHAAWFDLAPGKQYQDLEDARADLARQLAARPAQPLLTAEDDNAPRNEPEEAQPDPLTTIKLDRVDTRALQTWATPELAAQLEAARANVAPGAGERLTTLPMSTWRALAECVETSASGGSVPNQQLLTSLRRKLGSAAANASRRGDPDTLSKSVRISAPKAVHALLSSLSAGEIGALLAQALQVRTDAPAPARRADDLAPNGRPRVSVHLTGHLLDVGPTAATDTLRLVRDAMRRARWPYAEIEAFTRLALARPDQAHLADVLAAYVNDVHPLAGDLDVWRAL